jgi:hypothetical protein
MLLILVELILLKTISGTTIGKAITILKNMYELNMRPKAKLPAK